ncbi:DUF2894 domain-containing protein [Roseateles sp. BYS96W]|uniref:DUF2894 domain-containing protein n=1 Tax=Pelomonas nitida TaxID=3299027 RepID=A0ABW7G5P5_9BURK
MTTDAAADPVAWALAQAGSDPVRARVLSALARRASAQPPGALRERLVARLMARAQAAPALPAPAPAPAPRRPPSPLATLVAELQAMGTDLRQVQAHQPTWRALRAQRRLAEVAAPVPEHLGPLNSQVLVARALQQLHALAPDYLQGLLTQVDTLAALAPLQAAAAPADKPARKTAAPRRR